MGMRSRRDVVSMTRRIGCHQPQCPLHEFVIRAVRHLYLEPVSMGQAQQELTMAFGSQQGLNPDINVTPMIDVLLVLLVIFMLSVQLRAILAVNVPPPADPVKQPSPAPQVVLDLREDGSYAINGAPIAVGHLKERLQQ